MVDIGSDFQTVYVERKHAIHVEEGAGTHGKRNAEGVPRLYVEVKNEFGKTVYATWQDGPLDKWNRVTLYFDRIGLDKEGSQIGFSLWD